ncbi:actin-related protein 6 isoform X2 [Pseudonaja textilis]|uniref:actin-related protein 6 isoform X2 n=1 Tax=Pseudonaja textilis TaxID=8673 RepID=UPI000EA96494|nr:actin-related protein 6 isoform X2 [Pseudonaja textilis]
MHLSFLEIFLSIWVFPHSWEHIVIVAYNQGREISSPDAEVLGFFFPRQWGGVEGSRHERKMATLVLDNGAYNAKIGYSHAHVSVIPNCQFRSKTARLKTFTANQLDEIKDPSGLFYILPFQKGYLVNWDVQRQVWDYLFGKEMYQVDFVDTNIIITEPYFNFSSIQESMNEILFEEYQFQAVLRVNAGALSAHRYFRDNPSELCCIIVDSGYSFTHIVPYCRSKKKKEAIIRINVGGKLLTNHLKEIISYRQLHVMDETHVINQVKEDVCYVSQDFFKDMEIAKLKEENTVMLDYVLPDFSTIKKGFCKPREEMVLSGKYKTGEQILRLTNERFAVPEILFHPSDIGIQEMGIPEAIVYSIQNLPEEIVFILRFDASLQQIMKFQLFYQRILLLIPGKVES